jgi:hypothetical protein
MLAASGIKQIWWRIRVLFLDPSWTGLNGPAQASMTIFSDELKERL